MPAPEIPVTNRKKFKQLVRDVRNQTGESYVSARHRLEQRRSGGAEPPPAASHDWVLQLAAQADLVKEEHLQRWKAFDSQFPMRRPRHVEISVIREPEAHKLLAQLESLDERRMFFVSVVMISGTSGLHLYQALSEPSLSTVEYDREVFIDYIFKKMPSAGQYLCEGLETVVREGGTVDLIWSRRGTNSPANGSAGGAR